MRWLLILCGLFIGSCGHADRSPVNTAAGPVVQKRIALSFDDGPRGDGPAFSGTERTQALIETLRVIQPVPAVFFVKTSNFKRASDTRRIAAYAAAGHLIANHTHSHQWLSDTDTEEYIADIDRAQELLQPFDNRRAWFRFPYLDEGRPRPKRDAVRRALAERQLINGYVTVDNYDWYIERKWQEAAAMGKQVDLAALQGVYVDMLIGAVEFYDDLAVRALGRSPVHMLLLHENDVAALFVDDLVRALRKRGWQIVSPDETYADPVASETPVTLNTRQGHVAALSIEAGVDPRTLTHLAIEEAQIDALIAARGVFSDKR